jgi:hypothetical protein
MIDLTTGLGVRVEDNRLKVQGHEEVVEGEGLV